LSVACCTLVGVDHERLNVLRLTGLEAVMRIYATVEAALAGIADSGVCPD